MTILIAARDAGLQAIDGPYLVIKDLDGFREMAMRSRALGYDGKWALHPGQIDVLNEVFAPTQDEFDKAEAILEAYGHATDVAAHRRGDVRDGDDRRGLAEDGRTARPARRARPACPAMAKLEDFTASRQGRGRSMATLAAETGLVPLDDEQRAIVETVRDFVEKEVIPVADELEHRDEFPEKIVEGMKELGLFGLTVPEEYGGAGLDLMTYALAGVELSRGWMSLSGILNTHFMAVYLLKKHGSEEQRQRWLPRMATGELRAALSMSEPGAGSDVQAIQCRAVREGDEYVVNGTKMWVTNGLRAGLVVLLCKTDPTGRPAAQGHVAC